MAGLTHELLVELSVGGQNCNIQPMKRFRTACLAFLIGIAALVVTRSSALPATSPTTRVAWLWDGAAAPTWSGAEVAVLLEHIFLRDDEILVRPRMQAPQLDLTTRVTALVHVEISVVRPPRDISKAHDEILRAVRQAARMSTSGWVQLDMEARPSQRDAYLALVRDIRRDLPREIKLSVTALAWWCQSDRWLDQLAADEVVPMFFRMGRDSMVLRRIVSTEPEHLNLRCIRDVAGFSVQEPFDQTTLRRYRKTYWFDNHRWRGDAGKSIDNQLTTNSRGIE